MACRLRFQHYSAISYSINRILKNLTSPLPPLRTPKVPDQLRERTRYLHYSLRIEEVYVYWALACIRFHGIRHPVTMAGPEVDAFLCWLMNERKASASAQGSRSYAPSIHTPSFTTEGRPSIRRTRRIDGRGTNYCLILQSCLSIILPSAAHCAANEVWHQPHQPCRVHFHRSELQLATATRHPNAHWAENSEA